MQNIVELIQLLEKRKNSLLDASEKFDLREIDMKVVSLIKEFICDDEPIILLDENDIKDIVYGKSSLYFGVASSTLTELSYGIQQFFKSQQLEYELFDSTSILVYVSCGNDTPIQVINKIASEIKKHVKSEVPVKIGCGISDDGDTIHIYIVGSNGTK